MAWRPTPYLVAGELDNTVRGRVTGWMYYIGLDGKVTFDLEGDFHRDIRGANIKFSGDANAGIDIEKAVSYMEIFALHQTGKVGDITAGLLPRDYVDYPYIEWYSDQNGRVVLELNRNQLKVIGTPIPYIESDPISRHQQNINLAEHVRRMVDELSGENSNDNNKQKLDDNDQDNESKKTD